MQTLKISSAVDQYVNPIPAAPRVIVCRGVDRSGNSGFLARPPSGTNPQGASNLRSTRANSVTINETVRYLTLAVKQVHASFSRRFELCLVLISECAVNRPNVGS